MLSDLVPTPLGFLSALLQPPVIYIIIALVVLCCAGALLFIFREQLTPYLYVVLDCVAAAFRGCQACGRGIFWCCAYMAYPIKEQVHGCADRCSRCWHPYKKRGGGTSGTSVPSFQF
mmetsp:Transcript_39897/g.113953  ORF Transcript_39897/g.113953 Transcript_39897/m.113953 type:complete len:117 (-) Transcript_39897:160-510(-)